MHYHYRGKVYLLLFLFVLFLLGNSVVLGKKNKPDSVRLLPEKYDVWSADWSQDGRIVFSGKNEGDEGNKMRIWLYRLQLDASPVAWTGTGALIDASPRWAPDGSGVVMVRKRASNFSAQDMNTEIWWKAFPSGEGLQLTLGPEDRDPVCSPDGKRVLFVRGEGLYSSSLLTVNLNDRKIKTFFSNEQGFISTPEWGVGDKIYYTLMKPKKKLVKTDTQSYECWGLDKGSIWMYDPETGVKTAIIDDEYDNRHPAVSPKGSYLAYVSTKGENGPENKIFRDRGSLYLLDLKTGDRFQITSGVSLNGAPPRWSPDGKELAFSSFRENRPAMWRIDWKKHAVKE
jgi:Tol biopolymer transport system component